MLPSLLNCTITLPVNTFRELKGSAAIIRPQDYTPEIWGDWFEIQDGWVKTKTRKGATTKTAKYSRTEIQGQTRYPVDKNHKGDVLEHQIVTLPVNVKNVYRQLHCGDKPLAKWDELILPDGKTVRLRVAVKPTPDSSDKYVDLGTVPLHFLWTTRYKIAQADPATRKPLRIVFYLNGKEAGRMVLSGYEGKTFKDHFGTYLQTTDTSVVCEVWTRLKEV